MKRFLYNLANNTHSIVRSVSLRLPDQSRWAGFTLVETVIVISVVTLVMGAVVSSVIYFYRVNDYAIEQAFAITSARRGVESMVQDIREATYSDIGTYPIVEMGSTTFILYSDVDRDDRVERIRYFLDGQNFKRGSIESSGSPRTYDSANEVVATLSDNVRNGALDKSIFEYYGKDGSELTDMSDLDALGLVRVNLVVNVNPTRLPSDFLLRSTAALRNIVND